MKAQAKEELAAAQRARNLEDLPESPQITQKVNQISSPKSTALSPRNTAFAEVDPQPQHTWLKSAGAVRQH